MCHTVLTQNCMDSFLGGCMRFFINYLSTLHQYDIRLALIWKRLYRLFFVTSCLKESQIGWFTLLSLPTWRLYENHKDQYSTRIDVWPQWPGICWHKVQYCSSYFRDLAYFCLLKCIKHTQQHFPYCKHWSRFFLSPILGKLKYYYSATATTFTALINTPLKLCFQLKLWI